MLLLGMGGKGTMDYPYEPTTIDDFVQCMTGMQTLDIVYEDNRLIFDNGGDVRFAISAGHREGAGTQIQAEILPNATGESRRIRRTSPPVCSTENGGDV